MVRSRGVSRGSAELARFVTPSANRSFQPPVYSAYGAGQASSTSRLKSPMSGILGIPDHGPARHHAFKIPTEGPAMSELSDRFEIADLLARYALAVDTGRWE